MKLGILNAISPEASGVNWGGTPVDTYIRFFESVNAPFTYVGYQVAQGQFPSSPNECDAYIITGSPRGVYDTDDWIVTLSQFIRDSYQAGIKLVGICFGHQILAHALGGRAEKSEKGRGFGLKSFDVTQPKAWMNGKPDRCSLYFAHQDQVVKLPPEAELLGGNTFCPIALYEIDNRVLGIQGHPEFSDGIMQDLLPLFEKKLALSSYEASVRSLDNGTPDNQLVAQWLVNFIL
jgi:GMP synthase-like glutamine amidotransferase